MNKFVAALAACLILFTPLLAFAQSQVTPGANNASGFWTPFPVDAAGVPKNGEAYPREYQYTNSVLFSSTVTAASAENVNPIVFTNSAVYGDKWLRIKLTNYAEGDSANGLAGGFLIRPKGSVDGVTFQHIAFSTVAAWGRTDTLAVDTLQWKIRKNSASPSANGIWIPLVNPISGLPFSWPYIQFALINRGSATATVEIEVMARQR